MTALRPHEISDAKWLRISRQTFRKFWQLKRRSYLFLSANRNKICLFRRTHQKWPIKLLKANSQWSVRDDAMRRCLATATVDSAGPPAPYWPLSVTGSGMMPLSSAGSNHRFDWKVITCVNLIDKITNHTRIKWK